MAKYMFVKYHPEQSHSGQVLPQVIAGWPTNIIFGVSLGGKYGLPKEREIDKDFCIRAVPVNATSLAHSTVVCTRVFDHDIPHEIYKKIVERNRHNRKWQNFLGWGVVSKFSEEFGKLDADSKKKVLESFAKYPEVIMEKIESMGDILDPFRNSYAYDVHAVLVYAATDDGKGYAFTDIFFANESNCENVANITYVSNFMKIQKVGPEDKQKFSPGVYVIKVEFPPDQEYVSVNKNLWVARMVDPLLKNVVFKKTLATEGMGTTKDRGRSELDDILERF